MGMWSLARGSILSAVVVLHVRLRASVTVTGEDFMPDDVFAGTGARSLDTPRWGVGEWPGEPPMCVMCGVARRTRQPGPERVVRLLVRVLRDLAGPVVVDLVVVEGDHPGRVRVDRGEVGIGLVLGVPVAVLLQGVRLPRALVPARPRRGRRGLV